MTPHEEQALMDEFLATTTFDETRDWRQRDDLDEDDDELRSLGSRDEALEQRATEAIRSALMTVLPGMLAEAASAGGRAALKTVLMRAAAAVHEHATTQVQMPKGVAAQMAAFPIADEDLAEKGRETDSHVTVKYGVTNRSVNDVRETLRGEGPVEATFGKVSTFEGVEEGTADAVVIEVESEDLRRLNKLIEDGVESIESKYEYKPHATIAYVKPGLGKKYAGDARFIGQTVVFDAVTFSTKDDKRISIPLDGLMKAAADEDAKFIARFDAVNPSVVEWAKRHAAELVTNILESTRDRIRLAVEEHQEDGDWEFFHDRVMAAVGDELRADLIARHETMLAAGEGQRLGWAHAEEEGLLSGKERREWIATGDERTCPICDELAGKTATLNGTYPGGYDGPPAHVQCRCTEGIIG